MPKSLILKYRPKTFEKVLGHDAVVRSVKAILEKKRAQAFLFTGPKGVGKTTMARVIANSVGCDKGNLVEVDAASKTGVDDMRALTENIAYAGLGETGVKVLVVDECHRLSAQAWDSILKSTEEPPPHVYWVFCSTNPGKIPATVRSRCSAYDLKPIKGDLIYDLLRRVKKKEGMKVSDEVLDLIAQKSEGSARLALSCLSQCADVKDLKEAKDLIRVSVEESDGAIIKICRGLVSGRMNWADAMRVCLELKDENPEGLRIIVTNYFTKVVMGTKTGKEAQRHLAVLDAFGQPYPASNTIAPFLLSLGQLLAN